MLKKSVLTLELEDDLVTLLHIDLLFKAEFVSEFVVALVFIPKNLATSPVWVLDRRGLPHLLGVLTLG